MPTALETMELSLATLSDVVPNQLVLDALFVHASPSKNYTLDEQLLMASTMAYQHGLANKIVINGLTAQECKSRNLSYPGHEAWMNTLEKFGMTMDDVVIMEPSPHTGAESKSFLRLASERGWHNLGISSQGYHQLRCFLTIIGAMNRTGFHPAVYNIAAPGVSWNTPMWKTTMTTGARIQFQDIGGSLVDHIEGEHVRIEKYSGKPEIINGEPAWEQIASIAEMRKYLEGRDSV